MATQISAVQKHGHAVAHVGKYHAQYQFAGRLKEPLTEISAREIPSWFVDHPDGRAVVYVSSLKQAVSVKPDFYQLYRGEVAMLVNREQAMRLDTARLKLE
jgi:hypothetical protein